MRFIRSELASGPSPKRPFLQYDNATGLGTKLDNGFALRRYTSASPAYFTPPLKDYVAQYTLAPVFLPCQLRSDQARWEAWQQAYQGANVVSMSLFDDAKLHRTTVSMAEMDYHEVQRLARRAGVPAARVIREALSRGLRSVADDLIAKGKQAVARRAELLRQVETLKAAGEHEEALLCEMEANKLEKTANTLFEWAHES